MDDVLIGQVYDLLDDGGVDAAVAALVMGACEDQLDDVLGGASTARRPLDVAGDVDPVGAYLSSVTVEGFRGIGPERTLKVAPGPGLTVIVGRNGSGKSTFAEAVEVTLTGTTSRWDEPEWSEWRKGWANVHDGTPKLRVEIVEEGQTTRTILERTWQDTEDQSSGTTVVRRAGADSEPLAVLGWSEALTQYRPILSHHEVGAMLQGKPSELHDALAGILGVGDLTQAITRLTDIRKQLEQPAKDVKGDKSAVLDALRGVADERAQAVLTAIDRRIPKLDDAELILREQQDESTTAIAQLQAIAGLAVPSEDEVTTATQALREAADALASLGGTDSERDTRLAGLLQQALDIHDPGELQPCPVCQTGQLDDTWRETAQDEMSRLRESAHEYATALNQTTRARAAARRLISTPPTVLEQVVEGLDASEVIQAWEGWAAAPAPDSDDADGHLAAHLDDRHAELAVALIDLRKAAQAELDRRHAEWRPVAEKALRWVVDAAQAVHSTDKAKQVKKAEDWLKEAQTTIKDLRFAPIREQTREVWRELRLASNVELNDIALTGKGPRRSVELDVTVDGTKAVALGVMSQGELHALALALFLPRATRPESPFRFVMIDDPVQAMDPARVAGLAQVLARVAKTRQVVVCTHDDRLPEAIRRMNLPGTILSVTRQAGSKVTVSPGSDPVSRAIADAKTMAKSEELDRDIRNRLVAGFIRVAVEAAATQRYTNDALKNGVPHAEIEERLEQAPSMRERVCLALFDSTSGDWKGRLSQWDRRFADVVTWANAASHGKAARSLTKDELWKDVHVARDLAEKLAP